MKGEKRQAVSNKLQANSRELQAASSELLAASNKLQAVSKKKLVVSCSLYHFAIENSPIDMLLLNGASQGTPHLCDTACNIIIKKHRSYFQAIFNIQLPLSVLSFQFLAFCSKLIARSSQFFPHRSRLFACSLSLAACSFVFSAAAQQVSATIDREKILLGEQITVQLKAENIHPENNPVEAWFNLPDTINHLEVVRRAPIDTVAVDGTTTYFQNIIITSFDSGRWTLPVMQLKLQDSTTVLTTGAFTIEVLPVDVSDLQQYHEMKDIIAVEVKTDWQRVFIFAIILIAAAILIYYLTKRKKGKPVAKQPVAKPSLFEETIAKLEALGKENLPAALFYTKLDEICRHYLQEQLYIRAMHLTQDELSIQLNTYLQQQDTRIAFYQLLRLMNAVKFAKYAPPAAQQTESIATAKATVQYIHYQLQRSQQHAQSLVSTY